MADDQLTGDSSTTKLLPSSKYIRRTWQQQSNTVLRVENWVNIWSGQFGVGITAVCLFHRHVFAKVSHTHRARVAAVIVTKATVKSCWKRSETWRKVTEQTHQIRNNYIQPYCWLTFGSFSSDLTKLKSELKFLVPSSLERKWHFKRTTHLQYVYSQHSLPINCTKLVLQEERGEVWALDRLVFMANVHGKPPGR